MNADSLLAHYEKVADAPDAITRLRRFVLDLAVRGKLVPQDARDEPASELLKRIAQEKARLVIEGEIKQEKPLDPISSETEPFKLPKEWAWTRLDALCRLITKGSSPKWQGVNYVGAEEGILFITSENVGNYEVRKLDDLKYVEARFRDIEPRSILKRGDILMNLVGASIGRTAIYSLDAEANINQAVALVRLIELPEGPSARYLLHYFNSPSAVDFMLGSRVTTAQPNMSLTDTRQFPVPLPPLAEQHRIVAKIDELMALCDLLEAARTAREAMRDRLTAASLARLNAPDPDTFQADARFALDALPALTMRTDQIKHLRKTILNLAVRGKLLPQNMEEEPASELLKRIAKEIPAAKIGNGKDGPWPFDVPTSWIWTHLGRLVAHSDAGWSPKTEDHPRNGNEWGVLKVSAVSWDTFRAWENKQVLPGTEPRLQAEVKRRDFLISRANTAELVARAVIVDEEPIKLMMSDKIVRLRLSENCDHRFVWIVNNYADFSREHYVRHVSGVSPSMKNVSRDVILSLPFPLPPLAEQHRIVAKVDELMALCDRLEANLTAATDTRGRLLNALLAEALAPTDSRELVAAE